MGGHFMNLLLNLLAFLNISNAAEIDCPYFVERVDGTQIQQLWSASSNSCFFSISPRDAYVDLIYRDYMLTSDGLFMVFNSYGEGDESRTTAAREFYTFPRLNYEKGFTHRWDREKDELIVTSVTGDRFVFEVKKAHLKSIERARVVVADYVEPKNRGGVEIYNFQGLLLDGGFAMGRAPTSSASGSSVFTDKNGKTCKVTNREVFKYTSTGDIIFKFDDPSLKKFLQTRCPSLATF